MLNLLNKYLSYTLILLVPLTHPPVRVISKLLFFLNLPKFKNLKKFDLLVLLLPLYQIVQSLLYGKLLLFIKIPQGITPVFSYTVRFTDIEVKRSLKILLFGISILSISVICQSLLGITTYKKAFQVLKSGQFAIHVVRPMHTFVGYILTAGAFISTGFFLSLFLYMKENRDKYLIAMVTTLLGLMFSFDRSYWVSTSLTLIVVFALLGFSKKRKKSFPILLGITVIITLLVFAFQPFKERIISIVDLTNSSNAYRIAMWMGGIKYYIDAPVKEKILGITKFSYKQKLKSYIEKEEKRLQLPKHVFSHLHNDYLTILVWYGVLGLILFLFTFLYMIVKNLQLFLITKDFILLFFACSYINLLIAGIFEYNFEDELVKYLIYILFALNVKSILKQTT